MKDRAAAKPKILILCTGNSCRSQMAEGILRHLAGGRAEVYSAGIEAHGLNPKAVEAMAEIGIDISGHESELASNYLDKGITHVITVCDHAAEVCPYFPGAVELTHFSFRDPAKFVGSEEETKAVFAAVRDEIQSELSAWWKAAPKSN